MIPFQMRDCKLGAGSVHLFKLTFNLNIYPFGRSDMDPHWLNADPDPQNLVSADTDYYIFKSLSLR